MKRWILGIAFALAATAVWAQSIVDFDVRAWAVPEFLETAAEQLIEEQWKERATEKLPEPTELQTRSRRIG
jgi:hypothetical protein